MSPPEAWLQQLRVALTSDAVVDDPDVVAGYSRDMAMLAPNGRPAAVVFPANTAEVCEVLRIASAHRVPVVPRGAGSGLAGDGNMHPTICFDPNDADENARAFAAFNDILQAGLALGGTITGEHGVGNIKVDWLAREIGPVGLRVHAAIKAALDPLGIMNPGKIFAPQQPVDAPKELAAVGR